MPAFERPRQIYWRFLSVRPCLSVLAGGMVFSAISAFIGMRQAEVPSSDGGTNISVWRLLAMAVGVLPAIGLFSKLQSIELVTIAYRRAELGYLAAMSTVVFALYLLTAGLMLDPALVAILARSLAGWFGLALISGKLFGWRLSWVIPVAVLCALIYWGEGSAISGYEWWEFTARPHGDTPSMAACVTILAIGVAAYSRGQFVNR